MRRMRALLCDRTIMTLGAITRHSEHKPRTAWSLDHTE